MTEPSRPRPVPGPPRPGPRPAPPGGPPVPAAAHPETARPDTTDAGEGAAFADLDQRPLAEHVAVFEAEHARLQRELATIDQL
jgi:hypothetical protein